MISKFLFSIHPAIRWSIFILYLALIVYGSLTPVKNIPRLILIPYADKMVHFIMYFGFCTLGLWSFDRRRFVSGTVRAQGYRPIYNLSIVLVLAVSWGLIMELFQRYMAFGREGSMYDVVANISGAIFGAALYHFMFRRTIS